MGHRMMPTKFFPKRPSLLWQRNLGHSGLDLGLRKRYIEDLCMRWGVIDVVYFGMGSAQLFESAHTHPPPQKSYVKYTKIVMVMFVGRCTNRKHLYIF